MNTVNRNIASTLTLIFFGYYLLSFILYFSKIEDSNFISAPFRLFVMGIALLFFVYYILIQKECVFNPLYFVYYLFWVVYITRLIHDCILDPPTAPYTVSDYIFYGIGVSFISAQPGLVILNNERLKVVYRYFFFALATVCLAGFANNIYSLQIPTVYRYTGNPYLNPLQFSLCSASLAIMCIFLLIAKNPFLKVPQIILYILILICILNMTMAYSRSPIIGFLLCVFIQIYYSLKNGKGKKIVNLFVLIALILIGYIIPNKDTIFRFATVKIAMNLGIGKTKTHIDASNEQRKDEYDLASKAIKANPIFGDYVEVRKTHSYPHNLIIEAFLATGIIGGFLFLIIYFGSFYQSVVLLGNESTNLMACLFIQYFVFSFFSGAIWSSNVYWCLVLVIIGLYTQHQKRTIS